MNMLDVFVASMDTYESVIELAKELAEDDDFDVEDRISALQEMRLANEARMTQITTWAKNNMVFPS